MGYPTRIVGLLPSILFLAIAARPAHAQQLRYRFQDMDEAMYHVKIEMDLPDSKQTHSGTLTYNIKSVDPASGQVQFGYSSGLQVSTQHKNPQPAQRFPGPPPIRPPHIPSPWADQPPPPDILIDAYGTVLRTNRTDDDSQLPAMQGLAWQLMLPPLPADGARTWRINGPTSIFTKTTTQSPQHPFRPPTPWERQSQVTNRTERAAEESHSFSAGAPRDGIVKIRRDYTLVTAERIDGAPALRNTGTATYEFDTRTGLVRSLDAKYTVEVRADNMTVRVPVTVTASLYTPEEIAKLKADREAAAAEAREKAERERIWKEGEALASLGTIRSVEVGGGHGRDFTYVKAPLRPVMGAKVTLAEVGGRKVVRDLEPLYARPDEPPADNVVHVLAKDGYAVGGLVVTEESSAGIRGLQVVYNRLLEDEKLAVTDNYRSAWVGDLNKGFTRRILGGKGHLVIGFYGKHRGNIQSVGLIFKDPDLAFADLQGGDGELPTELELPADEPREAPQMPAEASAQLKRIEELWQKSPRKPIDLLPRLKGPKVKNEKGDLLLAHRSVLESDAPFRTPVTFRIVCKSNTKDLRLGFVASQIIFNWDFNPDELRIDGGPASGQHRPGAGRLPDGEWCGIEMIVKPNELSLYVNGALRQRVQAHFGPVNKPFTLRAHGGDLLIHSIEVVR